MDEFPKEQEERLSPRKRTGMQVVGDGDPADDIISSLKSRIHKLQQELEIRELLENVLKREIDQLEEIAADLKDQMVERGIDSNRRSKIVGEVTDASFEQSAILLDGKIERSLGPNHEYEEEVTESSSLMCHMCGECYDGTEDFRLHYETMHDEKTSK